MVKPADVVMIGNFDFGKTATSDTCILDLKCRYSFEPGSSEANSFTQWFNKSAKSVLFYLGKKAIMTDEYF